MGHPNARLPDLHLPPLDATAEGGRLTDAAFILSVLKDGQKHSQADLLRRSFNERGCGLTVHSRVADLRKRGHYIVTERVKGADRGEAWTYQLVGSLSERDHVTPEEFGGLAATQTPETSRSESAPLFTYPRSPDWA